MSHNVETMFYTRETPWHGLGNCVETALTSNEALIEGGLNWNVIQKPILTEDNLIIPNYKANIRDKDNKMLGVVTDRYKVVQNHEAFAFVDDLLGEGVRFETAGSLYEGRKVWLLARFPQNYIISGNRICPYLVFSNAHDGSGSIKVAMTPIRVVCSNTLNLALQDAKRIWATIHTGNIKNPLISRNVAKATTLPKHTQKEIKVLSIQEQNALINVHALRHTFATRMLEAGESAKVVQELMGHSNISQTLNVYTHVLEDTKRNAMNKIDFVHS